MGKLFQKMEFTLLEEDAISALAFSQTLEYVFSSKPEKQDELDLFASNLVNWFEDGRSDRLVNVNYRKSI